MDIVDRIKSLCDARGIPVMKLEADLDFSNGTISKWKKSSPKIANVEKVAMYFHVSIDELLGNESTASPPAEKMPKDMKKYLEQSEVIFDGDVYHLDDEGREMVRQALKMAFLAAKEANKRKKK